MRGERTHAKKLFKETCVPLHCTLLYLPLLRFTMCRNTARISLGATRVVKNAAQASLGATRAFKNAARASLQASPSAQKHSTEDFRRKCSKKLFKETCARLHCTLLHLTLLRFTLCMDMHRFTLVYIYIYIYIYIYRSEALMPNGIFHPWACGWGLGGGGMFPPPPSSLSSPSPSPLGLGASVRGKHTLPDNFG